METVNKVVEQAITTVTRTIYGNVDDTEHQDQHTKPTNQQIRDDTTATPPVSHENNPTSGYGGTAHSNKPIATTTNEAPFHIPDQPLKAENQPAENRNPPLKDTAAIGHRRSDSGHAEADGITERFSRIDIHSGDQPRYGQESRDEDGISRTGDDNSFSPDGQLRPKFVGNETNDDGIRRSDGRDRVQFDDSKGTTGNLRPSGDPSPERPRQGSAGAIPHMDFGNKGGIPQGARIGTVQGGTVKDRQHGQDLEDAQRAQSGGFGGTPAMFGKTYDPTGTSQVQNQQQKQTEHSPPDNLPSSTEPHLQDHTIQQPGQAPKESSTQEGSQNHEGGHQWVKTSGTVADGGDFDAAKPGAGKEADRLLEQAGVHRTLDPRARKSEETQAAKDPYHHSTISSSANPTHHPDNASDTRGNHGGLHVAGILHHHDTKKDPKDHNDAAASKGLTAKIKEKLHLS